MIKDFWRRSYSTNSIIEAKEYRELFFIHSLVITASYEFFNQNNFVHTNVPLTTSSASSPTSPGSDSAPVKAIINGEEILLTDSAQFYLEYACRSCKRDCYYIGHSFRDEEPDVRHLSQFSHVEAELIGKLDDAKRVVENYIRFLVNYISSNIDATIKNDYKFEDKIEALDAHHAFSTIEFDTACEFLSHFDDALKPCGVNSHTITAKGEALLMHEYGEFLWVENWDRMVVPFYQAIDIKTNRAINADLLFGIGEVVGAGQRHASDDELLDSISLQGVDKQPYMWYTNMKKEYPLTTAGFGLGVERFLMWLLDLKDIRSVELFPRNRNQAGM